MKTTSIAAVALAAALGLSACGSADSTAPAGAKAGASSSSSSSSTSSATGAKVGDSVDFAEVMTKSAQAVKDKKTAHMTMDLASMGAMEADVDYGSGSPSMAMTMEMTGQKVQVVLTNRVMYMGGDAFAAMAGGKKWIKVDPKGTDPLSKQLAPMFDQLDTMVANPAQQFAGMKDVKATVAKSDSSGTTYDVKLTADQLLAQKDSVPGLGGMTAKDFPDGVSYAITLDKDQLPVAVDTEVKGQKVTVKMSKWGEPVDISAPPASEVGTFTMPKS